LGDPLVKGWLIKSSFGRRLLRRRLIAGPEPDGVATSAQNNLAGAYLHPFRASARAGR
jgi:hypothetical protein